MLILNKMKVLLNSNCWRTNYLRMIACPTKTSSLNYSTTKSLNAKTDKPYKFLGSKAENLTMDESFYNLENMKFHRKVEAKVVMICLAIFLIYFGILREENHLDDVLKGNYDDDPNNINLELQYLMQYEHCKKNHMKYDEILTKLNKIRKAKGRPLLD